MQQKVSVLEIYITLIDTYNVYPLMSTISSRRTNDSNYYNYGINELGNIITGTYSTETEFMIFLMIVVVLLVIFCFHNEFIKFWNIKRLLLSI